jgi:hypothetical protein
MNRTFAFLFLFLFFASCGKGGSNGSNKSTMADITEEEIATKSFAPVQAQTFEVSAEMSGFDSEQEQKILQAFDLLKKVIASDDFKNRILNKTYRGKKLFVDNNGLTNAQVYKKLLEGAEELYPVKNNVMDLHLETYEENDIVIGYTKPSIKTIFLNTKYLNRADFKAHKVAMNLMHEWLHKLGFKHAQENSSSRPHSVPYAIGYIMNNLASQL